MMMNNRTTSTEISTLFDDGQIMTTTNKSNNFTHNDTNEQQKHTTYINYTLFISENLGGALPEFLVDIDITPSTTPSLASKRRNT
jgi:hypothetical protein